DGKRAATREVPFVRGIEQVVQPRTVVVPQALLKNTRTMRRQEIAFRMESPADKGAHAANVRAVDKAGFGLEAGGNVLELSVIFPGARAALHGRMICRTRLVRAIAELGLAGHGLGIHLPALVDPDLRVHAAHAVKAHDTAQSAA